LDSYPFGWPLVFVPRAIGIGAVVEFADQLDRAFKGEEPAIAMIADMHHAPARGTIPVQYVQFPDNVVDVGWPAMGHRVDLRVVPVGLHVLLMLGKRIQNDPARF